MSTSAALAAHQAPRLAIFASGLAFVGGLSLVFVTFFYALSSLLIPFRTIVTPIAGALVIILGLSTAGLFRLPFLDLRRSLNS